MMQLAQLQWMSAEPCDATQRSALSGSNPTLGSGPFVSGTFTLAQYSWHSHSGGVELVKRNCPLKVAHILWKRSLLTFVLAACLASCKVANAITEGV